MKHINVNEQRFYQHHKQLKQINAAKREAIKRHKKTDIKKEKERNELNEMATNRSEFEKLKVPKPETASEKIRSNPCC